MMQTEPLSMTQSANRRIRSFRQRFSDGHFYLACHAALPLALTPDLLYRLWATFQRDCQDDDLAMPWIAVSDLLLSGLCDEVGDELYEMDSTVRDALMQQLKDSPRLGLVRVRELAEFVIAYTDPQRASADLDTRDFAQAQHWRALAYQQPRKAVQAIAATLAELSFDETQEWMRMAALVEMLEEPLVEFPELLVYVRAIDDFVRGNDRSAIDKLKQIADKNQQIQIADVDLPIPGPIKPDPLPTEGVTLERKIHLIDRLKQNAYWIIGGGIAVTTVAIGAVLYISSNTETSGTPPSIISAAPSSTTLSPQPTPSVSPSPIASESSPSSGIPTLSPTSTIQPVSQPDQPPSSPTTSPQTSVPDPSATITSIPTIAPQPRDQPIQPTNNMLKASNQPPIIAEAALISLSQEQMSAELATLREKVDSLESRVMRKPQFDELQLELSSIFRQLELRSSRLKEHIDLIANLDQVKNERIREFLRTSRRLSGEFAAELATLKGRADAIKSRYPQNN